jgi:hypothetical protein
MMRTLLLALAGWLKGCSQAIVERLEGPGEKTARRLRNSAGAGSGEALPKPAPGEPSPPPAPWAPGARGGPPPDWIEKVSRGAPELLMPPGPAAGPHPSPSPKSPVIAWKRENPPSPRDARAGARSEVLPAPEFRLKVRPTSPSEEGLRPGSPEVPPGGPSEAPRKGPAPLPRVRFRVRPERPPVPKEGPPPGVREDESPRRKAEPAGPSLEPEAAHPSFPKKVFLAPERRPDPEIRIPGAERKPGEVRFPRASSRSVGLRTGRAELQEVELEARTFTETRGAPAAAASPKDARPDPVKAPPSALRRHGTSFRSSRPPGPAPTPLLDPPEPEPSRWAELPVDPPADPLEEWGVRERDRERILRLMLEQEGRTWSE